MKPYFTIALSLLTLSYLNIHAQTQPPETSQTQSPAKAHTSSHKKAPKFFAGLSLGPSFPMGKFGSKNFADTAAGLAMVGPSLNISAGYMFTRMVGAMILFGGQENKMDPNAITRWLDQKYGDTVGTYASTKYWKTGRILAGGVFKIPLAGEEKLFFQGKILAGMLKTTYPGYLYAYGRIIPNLNITSNYYAQLLSGPVPFDWTFCYQANAGLSWQLTKRIALTGDISYFHADPAHKYDHYLVFNPGGAPIDHGPWQKKYEVASLNLMVGAEFHF